MAKKKVLITGVAGVIGQACVNLLSDKYELSGLDIRDPGNVPTLVADIGDLDAIQAAFTGMDAVVHLAGNPSVHSPWAGILDINIKGTYNTYEASRIAGVKAVVFASSNHTIGGYEEEGMPGIYALDDPRVYDHTVAIRPDSLYGVSKVFGEAVGRYYQEYHGVRSYNLRIGSVRGDDNPRDPSVPEGSFWLDLTADQKYDRLRATWLSKRDVTGLIAACIEAEDVPYAVVYGISDNPRKFWDLEHARELLGWWPVDKAPVGGN
ncbi:MAG TPA: NAD(P)-dependent oxidoreductase [Thermomicrobiales bacterium]|nr:NAD(P)-dependent oxidoreductase [Thermomicrobiales bacterium]